MDPSSQTQARVYISVCVSVCAHARVCVSVCVSIEWEREGERERDQSQQWILHTSEPVKMAGSLATNWEAVVGSADNLVKSFFTCSTISSCLTAPAAAIT